MPLSAARALVISIHDVSPGTWPACVQILAEMSALGVERTSLLVIPDQHRRGHFLADERFCEWLREMERAGCEIVTHGYYHQRLRRGGEGAMQKITTRIYTADEGEFFDLDRETARELVSKANAQFAQAGLHPCGFIAPAWLLSAEAEAALCELGVDYTTRLGSVTDLRTGRVWRSQSLVWSVRAAWRRAMSRAWNAVLFRRLQINPLMRISVHPVDIEHDAVWRQICDRVRRALEDREALTYHAWLRRSSSSLSPSSSPS